MILTPLQKLPKNWGDWGKLIVANGFKKSNNSLNLVTLTSSHSYIGSYIVLCLVGIKFKTKTTSTRYIFGP